MTAFSSMHPKQFRVVFEQLGNVVLILVFHSHCLRRERCLPYTTNYYSRRPCRTVRR